jgi:septum formation protein
VSSGQFILASSSPRRRELLESAGFVFDIFPADIDETDHPPNLAPADLAEFLAVRKAAAVAERFSNRIVLAADTVVALGDNSLGKPIDAADAAQMLARLSGNQHEVVTGVCVEHRDKGIVRSMRVLSQVKMRILTDDEIRRYVQSGHWEGKAGGYGIQDDLNDPLITNLRGSRSNIVGLPMEATTEMLAEIGVVPKMNADC